MHAHASEVTFFFANLTKHFLQCGGPGGPVSPGDPFGPVNPAYRIVDASAHRSLLTQGACLDGACTIIHPNMQYSIANFTK